MKSIEPINEDISKAQTLHTDFYISAEIFEQSKKNIFEKTWHFIPDVFNISDVGSVYPFILLPDFLNEPLVLTKDSDERMHCLSNVCTHRGNLLAWEPCRAKHLICKYHGRRFALNGTFEFMPEFKEVKDFPSEKDNLHSLSLKQWGTFMFTSLFPEISFDEFFGDMIERMHWFPMQKLQFRSDLSKDYYVNAHWALYCENYLEGFHIPFVHPDLNKVLDFGNYKTELFRFSNVQIGIAKEEETCFDMPPSSPDYGKKIAAYYFWVFPNMMFNFYPWGVSVNIVEPVSIEKTKVRFLCYVSDESKLENGAGSNLDKVEMEDEEVVEHVQRGVKSRFYHHGRYSVTREQGTHHFHRILTSFLQNR